MSCSLDLDGFRDGRKATVHIEHIPLQLNIIHHIITIMPDLSKIHGKQILDLSQWIIKRR